MKRMADANAFVPHSINGVEDVEWIPANRQQVQAAGLALHHRLYPGSLNDPVGEVEIERVEIERVEIERVEKQRIYFCGLS